MKKVIITILILAVIAAGAFGGYRYFFSNNIGSQIRVSSSSEDAVYVDSVSVITGYGSETGLFERYSGEVEPQYTLEVKLESDRNLKECFVNVGDAVEKGQELFAYDTLEDENKIAQDEIDIEKNQMTIESNETLISQQEKLMESYEDEDDKTEASLSILSLQNENRSLEYDIQKIQLEIESLKENISEAVVTAEISGIIQKINDPDDLSDTYSYSEDSSYITILSDGDYRIKGTVNELNYYNLCEGMEVIIYSRIDPSLTWKGTITEISDEKDTDNSSDYYYYYDGSADTSTYTFYVDPDKSDGLLLGQHVYMEEDKGQDEIRDGLWLADYYIMHEDGHDYVWLANLTNVLEKHEIELGEFDEDLQKYEVADGLKADDYIAFPEEGIYEGNPVIYNDIAEVSDEYDDWDDYDWDDEWDDDDWDDEWDDDDWDDEWDE